MTDGARGQNVVVDFGKWYQRHQLREHDPLARFSLDKCEEMYRQSDWARFHYWFSIFRRERPRKPNFDADDFRYRP